MARPLGVALSLLLALLTASICTARDLYVGDHSGWTTSPAEPYNHWAERNRFQVNDTLVFRYSTDVDAVLLVSQSHYDACNTIQPYVRLGGGVSRFVLRNSGPYFFISGDARRCEAGERLIVVVLAVRNRDSNTPSSPVPRPPAPPKSTPASAPPVPSPAPGALSPSPPPPAAGNASSPSPAPATAPVPGTNGTSSSPPSRSSAAVALRAGGVLACLVLGGAAILV